MKPRHRLYRVAPVHFRPKHTPDMEYHSDHVYIMSNSIYIWQIYIYLKTKVSFDNDDVVQDCNMISSVLAIKSH